MPTTPTTDQPEVLTTWRIVTEADTSSKARRTRTWTVEAADVEDARYEAHMNHYRLLGWNASASIWTVSSELVTEN